MKFIRIAVFVVTAPLFAGGFWLQMGTPGASHDATAKNAALVVRASGCHDPATAKVTGVVVRMVDGQRQTTPLKLVPMKEPGAFAVMREWPADASVTLEFVGHNFVGQNGVATTSMLVKARGESVEKASAKFYAHEPTPEEEMALLVR